MYLKTASARVSNDITMEHLAAPEVTVRKGTKLDFRLYYHFFEQSEEVDKWTFKMTISVNGQPPITDEREHRDHILTVDDIRSFVGQDYKFKERGTFNVDYEAFADLSRNNRWEDDEWDSVVAKTIKGKVVVHVE